MGNNSIFGISIYIFNDDYTVNTLFEQKYDVIMSDEQIKEAYLFYTELTDKNNIRFNVFIEYAWHPITLNTFLEFFGGLDPIDPNT